VLTAEVVEKLEGLLAAGKPTAQAARELGLKPDTVAKAVRAGRLGGKKGELRAAPASGL
jgi:uroporphyrinogen-III synthase